MNTVCTVYKVSSNTWETWYCVGVMKTGGNKSLADNLFFNRILTVILFHGFLQKPKKDKFLAQGKKTSVV
jgi:hypothetical protein